MAYGTGEETLDIEADKPEAPVSDVSGMPALVRVLLFHEPIGDGKTFDTHINLTIDEVATLVRVMAKMLFQEGEQISARHLAQTVLDRAFGDAWHGKISFFEH